MELENDLLTVLVEVLFVVGLRPLSFVWTCSWCDALVLSFTFDCTFVCADWADEKRGTSERKFERVHPTFAGGLWWRAKDEIRGRQRLRHRTHCFLFGSARRPNRLIHRMEKLEAKSVFLARPLNDLTRSQKHSSNPMRAFHFRRFVQQQKTRLENAPKLRPWLERAANLEPVGKHNYRGVLKRIQQFTGNTLLFLAIRLSLCLVRLFACQLRVRRCRLKRDEIFHRLNQFWGCEGIKMIAGKFLTILVLPKFLFLPPNKILTLFSASALSILGLCSFHTEMPARDH